MIHDTLNCAVHVAGMSPRELAAQAREQIAVLQTVDGSGPVVSLLATMASVLVAQDAENDGLREELSRRSILPDPVAEPDTAVPPDGVVRRYLESLRQADISAAMRRNVESLLSDPEVVDRA